MCVREREFYAVAHSDSLTMQEHDCTLTREIVELVDREADLLVRGMKEETLQGRHIYLQV